MDTLQYELPYQSLSVKHKIEFAICCQKFGWEITLKNSHGKAQGKLMSSAQQTVHVFRPLPRPPGVTLLTRHAIMCVVSLLVSVDSAVHRSRQQVCCLAAESIVLDGLATEGKS